jgi:hypothetical protein
MTIARSLAGAARSKALLGGALLVILGGAAFHPASSHAAPTGSNKPAGRVALAPAPADQDLVRIPRPLPEPKAGARWRPPIPIAALKWLGSRIAKVIGTKTKKYVQQESWRAAVNYYCGRWSDYFGGDTRVWYYWAQRQPQIAIAWRFCVRYW